MFENDRRDKRWAASALVSGSIAIIALLAGCGKEPSMASRSAAAFREAQKKGATFEGAAGSHGHGALTPGEGQDHSGAAMGGMDMGGKGQSGTAMGGMNMGGKDQSGQAMGGMDHSGMDMGAQGSSAGDPAVAAPVAASPGQPAKTLRSDPLDSPAATSVLDARRSAAMAQEMGGTGDMGGMSGMSGHGGGTYRQVDAGRGPGAYEGSEKQTPGAEPHQHGQAMPPPSGQESEHSHAPGPGAAQEETAVYTCPMHPEVTSKTPGKCPKCGMTLVKRRKG